MKIGYIYSAYPEKRCIIDKVNEEYVYYNIRKDFIYFLKSVSQKVHLINYWDKQAVVNLPSKKCDIWHTFNQIPKTKNPYIISFETAVPRNSETIQREWEWKENNDSWHFEKTLKEIKLLEKENCKRLLPISKHAYAIQMDQLKILGCTDEEMRLIENKMEVLYPPQSVNISEKEICEKFYNISERIEFVFVGNEFFKKGGAILVDVLRKYSTKKIHLTLITSFRKDNISGYTEREMEDYIEYIKMQNWITVCEKIDNNKVMNILKNMHVGLLPTIQETFGYSVLEMQASGVPVITTDIRALSEINNSRVGWCIEINKHPISGEAFYRIEIKKIKEEIANKLDTYIKNIIKKVEEENYEILTQKAFEALAQIDKMHNPIKYAEKLYEIYYE